MALAFADRVRETTTTTGTGTITLAGAVTGYQSFSAIGNGNTTYYTINAGSQWEVGIGTYTASGTTLSRDTVLSSSNAGSLVDFSAGTKDVFVGYPAGKVVIQDASGNVGIGTGSISYRLHVNSGAATTVGFFQSTGTSSFIGLSNASYTTYLGSFNDGSFRIQTPGSGFSDKVTVDISGNLLVGTTSATAGYLMSVNGALTLANGYSLSWGAYNSGGPTIAGSTNFLAFYPNGASSGEKMRIDASGSVTANVDIRAPIFYDSANTAYYLDPTGSTSLNVAGNMLASGNLTLNNGANRYVRIGSATNYSYDLQTTGDDFQIIEAGTTPRLTIKYPNGNVGIGTSSPSARLAAQVNSGNYLLDLVNGSETGFALRTYNHGSASAPGLVFTQGLYYATTENASIKFYRGGGATGGYLGFTTGSGTEQLSINSSGNVTATVDVRAPIFYDSGNTAYYIDAAGNNVLNTLYFRTGSVQAKFAQASNFGYSASYRTVVLGNEYLTTISMGVDVSGNASGSFNGQGEGREVIFRNGVQFITPNAANNSYLIPFGMADGYAYSPNSLRAPIFYDTDNTGYYVDPASTSVLSTVRASTIQFSSGNTAIVLNNGNYQILYDPTGRAAIFLGGADPGNYYDNTGHYFRDRSGTQYGSITASGMFAPIFYDFNDTSRYLDPANTSVISNLTMANSGPVLVLKDTDSTGAAQIGYISFQDSGNAERAWFGYGSTANTILYMRNSVGPNYMFADYTEASGSVRSPIFYDSDNTAYYVNPAGTSYVSGDFQVQQSSINGIRLLSTTGTQNLWIRAGYDTDGSATPVVSATNIQFQSSGSSAGSFTFVSGNTKALTITGDYAQGAGSLRAPIFYDSNNTGYYLDPQSGSRLGGQLLFDGGSQIQSNGDIYARRSSGSTGVYYFVDGVNKYLFWDGGQYLFGPDGPVVTNGASMRAPIFYDVNNTAYYVDAAGTSVINSTQFGTTPGSPGNGRVITSPGSPYSIRQEFGTDNSGWRYGIAKNASGTVTVLFYVQDNGDCVATGNVTAYSDIRVKDNVETIPAALAKLSAIRGVTYTRTDLDDKERRYAGVIAQEIEQVLPEAIGGDEHIKTVDYNATIALLIQAVKELSAKVEALEAKEY